MGISRDAEKAKFRAQICEKGGVVDTLVSCAVLAPYAMRCDRSKCAAVFPRSRSMF